MMKRNIIFLILLIIATACILLHFLKSFEKYELYKKDDLVAVVSNFPIVPSEDKISQNVLNDLNNYYGENNYIFSVDIETNSFKTIQRYGVTYSLDIKSSNEWDGKNKSVSAYKYTYDGSGKLISVYYGMSEVHINPLDGTTSFAPFTNVTMIWSIERK